MTFKYRYRKQIFIGLSLLIIIGITISWMIYDKQKVKKENTSKSLLVEKKSQTKEKETKPDQDSQPKEIMVDVKGEVVNAGIYTLKEGSRVIDAINLAGGITQNADTSVLNLSKKLEDEMVIIVYSYDEVRNFSQVKEVSKMVQENCKNGFNGVANDACIDSESTEEKTTEKVSINKATLEELMTLPGIGEAKAKSIIEYREKNGDFQSIEQLKEVSGIGDSLFDQIKENITL